MNERGIKIDERGGVKRRESNGPGVKRRGSDGPGDKRWGGNEGGVMVQELNDEIK